MDMCVIEKSNCLQLVNKFMQYTMNTIKIIYLTAVGKWHLHAAFGLALPQHSKI